MKIAPETKSAMVGVVIGAVAVAAVGFGVMGWTTSAKAEAAAAARSDAAVVEALAPVCVAQFRRDAAADANLVAFKKLQGWSQGEYIEKGGWATIGTAKANAQTPALARACSEMLGKT
jgi:hypothetical protein